MAAKDVGKTLEQESISGMPVPSLWWSSWHALKGTNSRRLTISEADLRNKWIVLTGGNSGIGFEAALQFVKWGANIVLGCRQPPPHEMHPDAAVEKLKAAALAAGHENTVIEWWKCDMSSLESVEAFGKRWLAKDRPLDILANNAGMPEYPGQIRYTKDGFEILHQVRNRCL
jgi:NAD(P)-dependent dehydrogenase (short-subunit alcohol dehydrogenase family)